MVIYVWKCYDGFSVKTEVIDYASSVIWVSRFCDCGEFELYIPASKELVELFRGEVLFTRDDSETTMVLEKVQLTTDVESGDFLIVSGRSLESVLARRVVNRQTILDGTLADGIKKLLNENVINPITPGGSSDDDRKIPNIEIGSIDDFTDVLKKQITGENLLSAIIDICTTYGYGFKLNNKNDINRFVFSIYSGQDVSNSVVFSPGFGNISTTEYSFDYSNSPNMLYIAGEGEGIDRVITLYEPRDTDFSELKGLSRKEYWVDQRDCSSKASEPMLDTFYLQLLQNKGQEKYEEMKPVVNYSGEIVDNGLYKYGVDYSLGDTVLIENNYGIIAKATIIEITEVEDTSGYTLVPKLSEWRVTDV